MKTAMRWAIVMLALCQVTNLKAEDSQYDLIKSMSATIEEMTGVISGIKDAETATANKEKLGTLFKKFKEIVTKLPTAKEPTEDQKKELEALNTKLTGANEKFQAEMARLAQNEGAAKALEETMKILTDAP